MRINVYSQEIVLNEEPVLVTKQGLDDNGQAAIFYGVRFYLHSSDRLHFNDYDDDRSAITFWLPKSETNIHALGTLFMNAATAITRHVMTSTSYPHLSANHGELL